MNLVNIDWANKFESMLAWIQSHVLVRDTGIELSLILLSALIAWRAAPRLWSWVDALAKKHQHSVVLSRFWSLVKDLEFPMTWLVLQYLSLAGATAMQWRHGLIVVTTSLLTAWIAIKMASVFVKNPLLSKSIAATAWCIAALNLLGWLDGTVAFLEGIALTIGSNRISALIIVKGLLTLGILLWIAGVATNVAESRIKASPNLTPSVQVLSAKLLKMFIVAGAFLLALGLVGIDLSAITILGGAIGVGIGFGLQKIFANLISGFILLFDKSIKPGDVIAVGDYYGRVDQLGGRYVSVWTRDGIEHLIPNEDLIVNRVENWSHSQNLLRLRLPVGVHYKSDVPLAIKLCLEAVNDTPRVLSDPKSVCLLRGFGDSSVDLEIRFWINDPMNGRANVSSQVLLGIWERFHANDIEIPYPQRDLHLRSVDSEINDPRLSLAAE